jgi:uncharacterized protein (DUF1501 family)
MHDGDTSGCSENNLLLSRRVFLGGTAALFTGALLSPGEAFANQRGSDPRLLIVILRGGLDGLSTIIPYGDSNYESYRGDLVIQRDRIERIGPFFGLHPAMRNLLRFYRAGNAALIPATGLPVRTRSHFECQANLENGLPGNLAGSTGWVNRLLATLPRNSRIVQRGGTTIGPVPQILAGPAPVLSWTPNWFGRPDSQVLSALERMYGAGGHGALSLALERGLQAEQIARGAAGQVGANLSPLETGFRGAARLLGAANGPRVAVLSASGWDTHNAQGNLSGQIANRLSALDAAFGAFRQEMSAAAWAETVVLCATEFGRSVFINGTSGTDHGVGMPVILLGGAVNGGLHGDWPGLERRALISGRDLRPTVDLRSVFKGVLRDHLGATPHSLNTVVFPESTISARPMNNLVRSTSATQSASGVSVVAAPASGPSAELRDLRAYRTVHGVG